MYAISIVIGIFLGYCYWLSLLGITKRATFVSSPSLQISFTLAASSLVRLCIVAGIFYYLLRQKDVHSILVLLIFLISLWTLLLVKKDYLHGHGKS